jgi:hypothetical protein
MASCKRSYDRSYGGASHRIAVHPKPSYPGRPARRENGEVWREDSAYWRDLGLVGAGGFEPPNTGSKVPRLTPVEVGRPRTRPCSRPSRLDNAADSTVRKCDAVVLYPIDPNGSHVPCAHF